MFSIIPIFWSIFPFIYIKEGKLHTIMGKSHKDYITNRERLEDLQMSNIVLSQTDGWMARFQDDILILHNPVFKVNWEPYRMKSLFAVICDEGSGSGAVNLRSLRLRRNSFLIVLSSQIIESYKISEDFKGTFLLLSDHFLSRIGLGNAYLLHSRVESNPLYQLDEKTAATFRSYFDLLHNLMEDTCPNKEEALGALVNLFFLMVGRISHPTSAEDDAQHRQGEVMMRFLQLVKDHCREHREVRYYADKMNMSAKYMSALIKNASGKSAIRWIEDYVILEAKAQLASTVNTVQQIAFDLNFPSQSLFGRYFKLHVGMSPSTYRASVREHLLARP